jgi:hypothetical protein
MHLIPTTLAALLIAGAAAAQTAAPDSQRSLTEDEELSLTALEGLMSQRADRALPIIKKVLAGPQTKLVKQRALFVLSQIDSQEARDILLQMSRSPDVAMRKEAIRNIGIGGDAKSLDALQALYDSGDSDVKQEVLQAWLIAGRKENVYQAAVNAKSEDEAAHAIQLLGAMGATDELRKLGDRPTAPRGLLEAYAISGDLASLRKIADGSGDLSMRVDAVRKIGIINGDAARTALRDIYTRTNDEAIRAAALQGMLIARDDQGVLALYRAATSSEQKKNLLRTLTLMDSDAALKAIDAALEKK